MSTSRYRGFSILTQPYLLHESRRWTADVEIRRGGRSQPIALGERYLSEQEAEAHSSSVARLVIDGGLPKWSLEGMRGSTRDRRGALCVILPSWPGGLAHRRSRVSRALTHSRPGWLMRPSLIAGIVLLVVGAFILVRGGSFTTRENVLSVGDLQVSAEERQTIPGWVGAGALVAGVVVIVAGMRKRS
jgi:hypothetical protein